MKQWMSIVAILMMVLVLVACSDSANTPESVSRTFIEATFFGNIATVKTVVCAAMAAEITEEYYAELSAVGMSDIDITGLTFTASDVTDTSATVTVTGIMRATVSGETKQLDFARSPNPSLPLVKEDSTWKVCRVTG